MPLCVRNLSLKKKFSLILLMVILPAILLINTMYFYFEYQSQKRAEIKKIKIFALSLGQNWKNIGAGIKGNNRNNPHNYTLLKEISQQYPQIDIRFILSSPPKKAVKADPFEMKGLHFLKEKGDAFEYMEVDKINNQKVLRYMCPIYGETSCFQCHTISLQKHYSSTDFTVISSSQKEMLGAISFALPMQEITLPLWKKWQKLSFLYLSLFLFLFMVWISFTRVFIFNRLEEVTSQLWKENGEEKPIDCKGDEIDKLLFVIYHMNESIKEKVRSLIQQRDMFQNVTKSIVYAILAIDGEGRVLFFNEGAERMFGWQKEEIVSQKASLLIPPPFRQKYIDTIENYLKENSFKKGHLTMIEDPLEIFGMRKNGEEFTIFLSLSVGDISDKKVFTMIMEDITEQREKEIHFVQQNEKLVLLKQISTELLLQRDLKKLAEYSLYESLELTDSLCGLFLLQNREGDFVPFDMLGINSQKEANRVFKPVGVLGEIVRQKQPRIINTSVRKINRTILSFGNFSFYSFLGVPIIAGQELIGVICVANRIKGYTDQEQRLLVALANDISLLIVRNAIEKETKILEEKFRLLFDQSTDLIIITTLDGKILAVNYRVVQYTGYSYQELIDYHFWKLYLPQEERKCKGFIKKVLEKGSSRLESFFRQKDGGALPVDIQANIVFFEDQRVIQAVIRDVLHFKQSENLLREKIESLGKKLDNQKKEGIFFYQAMNKVLEFVIFTDPRGRILFTNESFCHRFHYTLQELIGRSVDVLFHSSVSIKVIDTIFKKADESVWKGQVVYMTKDGESVSVDLFMTPVRSAQQGNLGLLGIFTENQ